MTTFQSRFATGLEDFIAFKKARGISYESGRRVLHGFDRFVVQEFGKRERPPLRRVVEKWLASRRAQPNTNAVAFGVIRQLCVYLRRRDSVGFVPDRGAGPRDRKSHHVAYIFSSTEIRALLRVIDTMRFRAFAPRYRLLVLILFCTGLRIGEALRLKLRDVDLGIGGRTFYVEYSKGKSRWVPFEETLAREIATYRELRQQLGPTSPESPLFVKPDGSPYSARSAVPTASNRLRFLMRRAGLKRRDDPTGPRPYDLRHTFAVQRLTAWYREGVDVGDRIAWLSMYMGHNDLLGTEAYVRVTPELSELVSSRHERYVERRWQDG